MDRQQKLIVRAALNSAYMFATVEDLKKSYMNLEPKVNESKLTKSLKGALEIVEYSLLSEEGLDGSPDKENETGSERPS